MEHTRYTISQAAEMLTVRESQLRYWEDELDLRVHRNGQGHRYYTGYEIQMFQNVKELKRQGLQLRTIRERIPQIAMKAPGSTESKIKLLPMRAESIVEQEETVKEIQRKQESFQKILEKMIREEVERREAEEIRFRSLDQTIRNYQIARKEAALTIIRKRRFQRNKRKKRTFS